MMDSPNNLQQDALRLMDGFRRHGSWDTALSELDNPQDVQQPAPPTEPSPVATAPVAGEATSKPQAEEAAKQREPILPQIKALGQPFGDSDTPVLPVSSQLHGQVPMHVGGQIERQYPSLRAHSHVDWQHLNPRLLNTLNKLGEKRGLAVVISSGYRDVLHNAQIEGAKHSNHLRGTAIDAFVNGHPIGEVFTPEELAKVGIRSGSLNFPKGKPDSSHVDLMGTPIKTRTKEAQR
jgi:hypothetical protein